MYASYTLDVPSRWFCGICGKVSSIQADATDCCGDSASLVRAAENGAGPLSSFTHEDLARLVALQAPYGRKARAEYLDRLRQACDKYPCQYD